MCYNVQYIEKRSQRVSKHYGISFSEQMPALELFHVSGFVHPLLPVITSEQPQVIQAYQWGSDTKMGLKLILSLHGSSKPVACIEIKLSNIPVISNGFYESILDIKTKRNYVITPENDPYRPNTGFTVCGLDHFLKNVLSSL